MPTLVTIPFSHFCEKARWALDRTRIAYSEEGHAPLLHKRAVHRHSGKPGSVPVLVLDGDGVLDDSPLIVRWADARATSDRKLLPSGGRERDEALALERHLDVDFAPHVRRFAYFHLLEDWVRTLELMGVATPRLEHALVRALFPVLQRIMRRAMRIDAEHSTRSRDKIHSVFDAISHRLADGRRYLMGDRFGAVDLTFASFASPLLLPEQHPLRRHTQLKALESIAAEARTLAETPAGLFALRMYREHRTD